MINKRKSKSIKYKILPACVPNMHSDCILKFNSSLKLSEKNSETSNKNRNENTDTSFYLKTTRKKNCKRAKKLFLRNIFFRKLARWALIMLRSNFALSLKILNF